MANTVEPDDPSRWRLPEYPSYLDLLDGAHSVPTSARGSVDAIVVPAGRQAAAIAHAAQLAQQVGTVLVVLCSHNASAGEAAERLAGYQRLVWYAVDIPSGHSHPLLEQTARSVIPQGLVTRSDLSRKRNIGLILGKGLGDRLLFLDDDIKLQAAGVREAARLLSRYSMAGFRPHQDSFPDNSVAMHALRALRRLQPAGKYGFDSPIGQHISGNSLAINPQVVATHFPEGIYDEDWLFMYEATMRRSVARTHETSWQAEYDPFASPERAGHEEFGNIMSGGLYDHLKTSPVPGLRDERYWKGVLEERWEQLGMLCEAAQECSPRGRQSDRPESADTTLLQHVPKIERSLMAALEMSRSITPDMCVAYYRAWHDVDRPQWSARYSELPASRGVEHMLGLLELLPHTIRSSMS